MADKFGEEDAHANQEKFLKTLGAKREDMASLLPQHADKIVRVGRDRCGTSIAAEALMTDETDVVLALPTADCFPVALYDGKHRAIALAHCGWRPTGLGLPRKTIEAMTETFGTNPKDVCAFIGPGIHPESYIVEGVEQVQDPAWAKYLAPEGTQMRVDVFGYLYDQLISVGVPCGQIDVDPVDTAMANEYFSHYRSVRTGEAEGRFMTVIALEKE